MLVPQADFLEYANQRAGNNEEFIAYCRWLRAQFGMSFGKEARACSMNSASWSSGGQLCPAIVSKGHMLSYTTAGTKTAWQRSSSISKMTTATQRFTSPRGTARKDPSSTCWKTTPIRSVLLLWATTQHSENNLFHQEILRKLTSLAQSLQKLICCCSSPLAAHYQQRWLDSTLSYRPPRTLGHV